MLVWNEQSRARGLRFVAEVEGALAPGLALAVDGMVTKLSELGRGAAGDRLVTLEAGVDTGTLLAAIDHADGGASGCAVRLHALQERWYDLDESGANEVDFTGAIQELRRHVARHFGDCLHRRGRTAFPTLSGLRLKVLGGEPGEVLEESRVF